MKDFKINKWGKGKEMASARVPDERGSVRRHFSLQSLHPNRANRPDVVDCGWRPVAMDWCVFSGAATNGIGLCLLLVGV